MRPVGRKERQRYTMAGDTREELCPSPDPEAECLWGDNVVSTRHEQPSAESKKQQRLLRAMKRNVPVAAAQLLLPLRRACSCPALEVLGKGCAASAEAAKGAFSTCFRLQKLVKV